MYAFCNQCAINCLGRTWKKAPKAEGIASIGMDQVAAGPNTKFIRWKVHGDWVQQLKYHHDLRQVISCSNHSRTALVIGRCAQLIYRIAPGFIFIGRS